MNLHAQNSITIEEVHKRVKENNLEFKKLKIQEKIAKSNIKQASKFSNPEFEVELENLGKNEIGLSLSQSVELGGKRKIRIEMAELEQNLVKLESEQAELEITTETVRRILPLLALEQQVRTLDSFIPGAEKTLKIIEKNVEIGATKQIDKIRAEVELDELLLEKVIAINEMQQLKNDLSALWLGSADDFDELDASINKEIVVPPINAYFDAVAEHPETKIQNLERQIAQIELKDAKKSAIPDLSVGAGFVRNNELKENAYILSAGIELPIFNTNKDEIHSVSLGSEVVENEISGSVSERKAEIKAVYAELTSISKDMEVLENKILPNLHTIFQTLKEYYKNGSVSFLELIETQTELLETENRLMELHISKAELCNELYELSGYQVDVFENK